jgi:hypothetical protein
VERLGQGGHEFAGTVDRYSRKYDSSPSTTTARRHNSSGNRWGRFVAALFGMGEVIPTPRVFVRANQNPESKQCRKKHGDPLAWVTKIEFHDVHLTNLILQSAPGTGKMSKVAEPGNPQNPKLVSTKSVQAHLRHTDIATTLGVYTQAVDADVRKLVNDVTNDVMTSEGIRRVQ